MIINRLTISNFGVYAGENTFEFTNERPVVLIGGMNGHGKTTFLEAILLALYGSNSIAYKESSCKSYSNYLRSYVNKNSWNKTSYVELEFTVTDSACDKYLIHREWDALSKRTSEIISVKKNGTHNDFLTQNWAMFIEGILPSALSSFYFFDGEKIAELAVDETNTQMKESIRSMLGISILDVLQNDLGRSLRRNAKKANESHMAAQLEVIRTEKDTLTEQLKAIDERILTITSKIEDGKGKIDALHRQYQLKGGTIMEQRQLLLQQRAELIADAEQNQNILLEIAAGELPLFLVNDLIQTVKLQAEDEHNDLIMRQALDQIELLLSEYLLQHEAEATANKEFVNYIREFILSDSTEQIYQVSDHALFQLNALLEDLLEQSKQNARLHLQRKKVLKQKLDEVDSYLSLDISEKELSRILGEIKIEEAALIQLKVEHSSLQQERSAVNAELITKTAEFNRSVEIFLQEAELMDDTDRTVKYVNIALQILEKYRTELQKRKTGVLGETITNCYKQLANKKNLIYKIVMDPCTLDIHYLDDKGNSVSKDSLSAGEKQLMVISILWALAICSKKKLPVIIDTPLSRLDSMHRASLVTTYFPQASDQTIILSTDSEIDQSYYEMMKDYVGDEFTLDYSEETRSTTILKGYFQAI